MQKVQNIIELASGKCELFNQSTHLDIKTLKTNREVFVFIQNHDSKSKSIKDNQSKLGALLKK